MPIFGNNSISLQIVINQIFIVMKKFLLFFLIFFNIQVYAYDFEVDGFYYNLTSANSVAITYGENKYQGDIIIPDSVTYNGRSLKVVNIGASAFKECVDLTSVQLTNNIYRIGESAFYACNKLSTLTIPTSINYIEKKAFYGCSNLKKLTIEGCSTPLRFGMNGAEKPSSVFDCKLNYLYLGRDNYLSYYFDLDCSELSTIILSNYIENIEGFENSKISQITIPSSVIFIKEGTFKGCSNLKKVFFEDGEQELKWQIAYSKYINNSACGLSPFYDCPIEEAYVGRILIPDLHSCIYLSSSDGPFDRTSIRHLTISNSLTSLCGFRYCNNLTEIDIPASVNELYGFNNSNSILSVKCRSLTPPSIKGYAPFVNNTYLNGILYVPNSSIDLYKADNQWGYFFNIQGLGDSPMPNNKCETPTIYYSNGKLSFKSETSDVTFHSSISDSDIKSYNEDEVNLNVCYNICVYASKLGYDNSDVANATLCWIEVDPSTEGISDGVTEVLSNVVLIQTNNGIINITGLDDGVNVSVYGVNGQHLGSTISKNSNVSINTHLQSGSIAIIKIGDRGIKTIIR